jgi:hypothetical protein
MNPSRRPFRARATASRVLLLAGLLGLARIAFAADPKAPPVGPFDSQDPDIKALRALKWSDTDFAAQRLRVRCAALIAMKEMSSRIGGKADAQLELLVDYIEEQKLGEQFVGHQAAAPEPPGLSYDDGRKLATAFVLSPIGADKFGDELQGCDEKTLSAYERMYEKSARSAFDQTVESRYQVRVMASFLRTVGKFDDFVEWTKVQQQQRQQAYEQEMKRRRQVVAEGNAQKQIEADAAYARSQAEKQAAHEQAAMQMEAASQLVGQQPGGAEAAPAADHSSSDASTAEWPWYNGSMYWPWRGAYYANNAYRGAVRDKADNATEIGRAAD